jgi:SWI/SNF-related matrix-associated actin-dependent regulator 1 of chromatin subfamily A
MPTPLPHQIAGAQFLASREKAFLADFPRVGKTGPSVMACDLSNVRRVLVITTASNRANFGRDFAEWQALPRKVQVLYKADEVIRPDTDVLVIGWSVVADRRLTGRLKAWNAEALILDESHYARTPGAKRCVAAMLLAAQADRVFCLSGTPMPNGPHELWPILSTIAKERIDNMHYHEFVARYCRTKSKFVAGKRVDVIVGGKNLDELRDRLDGFWLRRTQADVGIREPLYSMLPLEPTNHPWLQMTDEMQEILDAAEAGDTVALQDTHLNKILRLTGTIKAPLIADYVAEELTDGGLDKVVLMCWHTDVINWLCARLGEFGVARLDGATTPANRQAAVERFQSERARVFVGQIQAAGEAIDLSTSCNLIFVEGSWSPKDMGQAALRITNHGQERQCLVRFAALAGSIDEAVMTVLKRKVATIKEVLPQ